MQKGRKYIIFILACFGLVSFGCATSSTQVVTQMDSSALIGKWRGTMTVPVQGLTDTVSRHRPGVELEIFDARLRGKLTRFFTNKETISIPFAGKIESGALVSTWSDGKWFKLDIHSSPGKMTLKGPYDFIKIKGTISLKKLD